MTPKSDKSRLGSETVHFATWHSTPGMVYSYPSYEEAPGLLSTPVVVVIYIHSGVSLKVNYNILGRHIVISVARWWVFHLG